MHWQKSVSNCSSESGNGAVVFVGDGKGGDALEPFWDKIKRKKSVKIKAVAIDMSPAYTKAVRENLPKAQIVYDHFLVIKLYNEKLSDFSILIIIFVTSQ
jgi:hypothetical protein